MGKGSTERQTQLNLYQFSAFCKYQIRLVLADGLYFFSALKYHYDIDT
jgi:hypothetical protein